MRRLPLLLLCLAAALLLAACGNKGPLVRPPTPATSGSSAAPVTLPAPAASASGPR